jgi:t-SNARE complex subunit (syntaxin)
MEINEYQTQIRNFIEYPVEVGPFTVILELQKNVGNLSEKLNKVLINDHGSFSQEDKIKVAISLGDILNNISNIATDLSLSMNDVISINMTKLSKSKKSDT